MFAFWERAIERGGGGLLVDESFEHLRLRNNGIVFHELEYEELIATATSLFRVLLLPNLYEFVDMDHLMLWSWMAQLLNAAELGQRDPTHDTPLELLNTSVRAALATTGPRLNTEDRYAWELEIKLKEFIPFHLAKLMDHHSTIVACAAFPALEGTLRRACANYVDVDGTVLKTFKRVGRTDQYAAGATCSSLLDLLVLLADHVAEEPLRSALLEVRGHLQRVGAPTEPFAIIRTWRNELLHGERISPTIGGAVLTLALLAPVAALRDSFAVRRARAWMIAQSGDSYFRRSPWTFYPPV
jgi:hypothetical protein